MGRVAPQYDYASIEAMKSIHYPVEKTGLSHPIILTEISGMVEVGDEIAAYANGESKIINASELKLKESNSLDEIYYYLANAEIRTNLHSKTMHLVR